MNIRKVLESGRVVRYHATLIDHKQNNAEHQWEVAVILRHIYPAASANLMLYALTHDSAEAFTGDLPSPVKKKHPEIKKVFDDMEKEYMHMVLGLPKTKFSKEELTAVKYADILSGLYFTTQRIKSGDSNALPIRDRWVSYIDKMPYLNVTAEKAIEELKQ